MASFSEPVTLDPQKEDDDAGMAVWWRIYQGLYDSGTDGEQRPILADGEPEQVSPKKWRVKLREGVKFHNGEPFNAESAAFSINRIIDKEFGSTNGEVVAISGAKAVDDTTVEITTTEPDFLLPRRLEIIMMVPNNAKDLEKTPNGTGPYKMESFDSASEAVLAANPDYWGDAPSIKKVTIRFIADPGTRIQSLKAGEADVALNMAPDQAAQLPKVIELPTATQTGFIRLNTLADGPLKDPKVREALNLAIDRPGLAKSLYADYAEPAQCQVGPPWVDGRNDDLQAIPYDPDRAKQLIQEAGAEGETIELTWPSGVFAQDRPLGEAVAQQWEAVGVKVNLKFVGYNPFVKAIFTMGADVVDGIFTELNTGLAHAERQIARVFYTDEGVSSYSNPEVDALRKKALSTEDEAERDEAFKQLNQVTCDDWGGVFVLYRREIMGVQEGVEYTPHPPISTKVYYDEMQVSGGN